MQANDGKHVHQSKQTTRSQGRNTVARAKESVPSVRSSLRAPFVGHDVIEREEASGVPQAKHRRHARWRAVAVDHHRLIEVTLKEGQIGHDGADVLVRIQVSGCEIVQLVDVRRRALLRAGGRNRFIGGKHVNDVLSSGREQQRREGVAVDDGEFGHVPIGLIGRPAERVAVQNGQQTCARCRCFRPGPEFAVARIDLCASRWPMSRPGTRNHRQDRGDRHCHPSRAGSLKSIDANAIAPSTAGRRKCTPQPPKAHSGASMVQMKRIVSTTLIRGEIARRFEIAPAAKSKMSTPVNT